VPMKRQTEIKLLTRLADKTEAWLAEQLSYDRQRINYALNKSNTLDDDTYAAAKQILYKEIDTDDLSNIVQIIKEIDETKGFNIITNTKSEGIAIVGTNQNNIHIQERNYIIKELKEIIKEKNEIINDLKKSRKLVQG